MKPAPREGFSLLEVLMATSILLGSVIVLNQLAEIGRKNAADAQDLSTAQLLCETRLNELVSGLAQIEPVEDEPIVGAPGWILSVDVEPLDRNAAAGSTGSAGMLELAALRVTVAREPSEGRRSAAFTLVRWVPDTITPRSPDRPADTNHAPESSPGIAGRL